MTKMDEKKLKPQVKTHPSAQEQRAISVARRRIDERTPRLTTAIQIGATGDLVDIAPEHSDREGWLSRLEDLFGSNGRNFPLSQLNHLLRASRSSDGKYDNVRANAFLAAIEGAKPANEVEAMLAMQMVLTHELAMQAVQRTMRVDQIPQFDSAGNMAVKLLRTFTMQVEALGKLQRGGEQVVKVVHVHPGAQAIVGNVTTGANGATGGGGANEIEHQPHAKGQLPAPGASPMPEMRSADPNRQPLPVASRGRQAKV